MFEMKLLIHSQTVTVQPLEFAIGWIISTNTLLSMWIFFIHAEI